MKERAQDVSNESQLSSACVQEQGEFNNVLWPRARGRAQKPLAAGAMRGVVRRAASWSDHLLVSLRELLKAWVNELFHLGSSMVTALTVLIMLIFHRPGMCL